MAYEIKINKDKCIGCGNCEALCPKIFKLKDGKAIVVKSSVEKVDCEKEAKNSCPVDAISVVKK